MGFVIKKIISILFYVFGITKLMEKRLDRKYNDQYMRIINYHNTTKQYSKQFERQLQWYQKKFVNVSYEEFELFMSGDQYNTEKPGIILTFDDGYKENYEVAYPLLEKYGFTGYFMCSSDLVGADGYMTINEIQKMVKKGHVIGNHTATHHRMLEEDSYDTLKHEIIDSKTKLEGMIKKKVEIFCWCGGEEEHYTKKAFDVVQNVGYKYSFMTNSEPVTQFTDKLHIQRTNIEDNWPLYLVKFQLCGFMDMRFKKKRERVNKKLS